LTCNQKAVGSSPTCSFMYTEKPRKMIDKMVEMIIADLSSRKGLGDEWDIIDPEIQQEILKKWKNIILGQIQKY
jgi:hypothetical protein